MEDKKQRNSRKKQHYDITHIGEIVAQKIEENPRLSYQIVADQMGIGKAALIAKTKLAYFGTADTIAEASKVLGVNLFEPFVLWLKKEGIPTDDEYAQKQLLLNDMSKKNEFLEQKVQELEKLNKILLSAIEIPKL